MKRLQKKYNEKKEISLILNKEVLHIYELFNVVLVETVRDIYESLNELPHHSKETVSTHTIDIMEEMLEEVLDAEKLKNNMLLVI